MLVTTNSLSATVLQLFLVTGALSLVSPSFMGPSCWCILMYWTQRTQLSTVLPTVHWHQDYMTGLQNDLLLTNLVSKQCTQQKERRFLEQERQNCILFSKNIRIWENNLCQTKQLQDEQKSILPFGELGGCYIKAILAVPALVTSTWCPAVLLLPLHKNLFGLVTLSLCHPRTSHSTSWP